MPTNLPTGFETYIYSHKDYSYDDLRQHLGKSHDPNKLPMATNAFQTSPLIMVEPCYANRSNDIFLYFRDDVSVILNRYTAEQLRDALVKVCEKPLQ